MAYSFANVLEQVPEPIKHEMLTGRIVKTFKDNIFEFDRFVWIELCSILRKHDLMKDMLLDFFAWRAENDKFSDDAFDAFFEHVKVMGLNERFVGSLGVFKLKEEF